MIDVVEDPCPILDVEEKPLDMSFLKIEGSPTMVTLPKVSALLADKLTAFAPHTIGVKFKTRSGLGHEHQVMKQFVDIAQLYEYGFSISELRRNYEAVAEAEITYRDTMLTPEDALRDTMRTSFDFLLRSFSSWVSFASIRAGAVTYILSPLSHSTS